MDRSRIFAGSDRKDFRECMYEMIRPIEIKVLCDATPDNENGLNMLT
jgi:hypothetical protein